MTVTDIDALERHRALLQCSGLLFGIKNRKQSQTFLITTLLHSLTYTNMPPPTMSLTTPNPWIYAGLTSSFPDISPTSPKTRIAKPPPDPWDPIEHNEPPPPCKIIQLANPLEPSNSRSGAALRGLGPAGDGLPVWGQVACARSCLPASGCAAESRVSCGY